MFLALRELKYAKLRYALIGFILVLITSLIFIVSGLTKGLAADNASSMQSLQANYLILAKDSDNQLNQSFVPLAALKGIKQEKTIKNAAPLTIQMASAEVNDSGKKVDVSLFATEKDGMLIPPAAEGNRMDNQGGIMADRTLEQDGVEIGDTLTINKHKLTITGFVDGYRYSHTPAVFISGEIFRQMMGNDDEKTAMVNTIALDIDSKDADSIKAALPDGFNLVTREQALENVPSYAEEQASLNMMTVFLFVISSFVLAVFFYVITLQKRSQFGVLKAIGAKTVYLIRSLIMQVILLSVICIGIGVGVSYGIKAVLPDGMPFVLTGDGTLWYSLLILAMAVIGSMLSLFQIAKVDPIEAIEGGA